MKEVKNDFWKKVSKAFRKCGLFSWGSVEIIYKLFKTHCTDRNWKLKQLYLFFATGYTQWKKFEVTKDLSDHHQSISQIKECLKIRICKRIGVNNKWVEEKPTNYIVSEEESEWIIENNNEINSEMNQHDRDANDDDDDQNKFLKKSWKLLQLLKKPYLLLSRSIHFRLKITNKKATHAKEQKKYHTHYIQKVAAISEQ